MTTLQPNRPGRVPLALPAAAALLAGGGAFYVLAGPGAWLPAAATAAVELSSALLILVAAGGYGGLLVRKLAPADVGGGFRAVTASAAGLWMFSTVWLVVGATVGLPGLAVSWAVVLAGFVLAGVQLWPRLRDWSPCFRIGRGGGVWILLAVAAGVWLAGAVRPPGTIGMPDAYDVMEYHLQAPREFYQAGRITPLRHNAYSFYPLGVEMLYLLAFSLRGGAYEGVYLAKLLHGSLGLLAVAALWTAGPERSEKSLSIRSRLAGLLLASTPGVLYVGWLAFSELGMLCYLAVGLGWLKRWLDRGGRGPAVLLGLMLGAACCAKYLAVGFVLLPVGLAMLAGWAVLRQRRKLREVLLTTALAVAAFSPWLVRNALATGNPVFPLATNLLGRGYWTAEEADRWRAGHGPAMLPPVPPPPGWTQPDRPGRWELFRRGLLSDEMGLPTLILAGAAVLGLVLARGRFRRFGWDWLLTGVLAVQVGLWAAVTHGLPWRFLLPAVVPGALLAGGGLERLARWRPGRAVLGGLGDWLGVLAWVVGLAAVAGNVLSGGLLYLLSVPALNVPPLPNDGIARHWGQYGVVHALPEGSRVMLIGDVPAWYYPPGTVYATVFDRHPLLDLPDGAGRGRELLEKLRAKGVTHLLVHWPELWRLSGTYGYPAELRAGLYDDLDAPPSLDWLADLQRAGAVLLYHRYPQGAPRRAGQLDPYHPPAGWPVFSIYAIPPAGAGPDWMPPPVQPPDESPGLTPVHSAESRSSARQRSIRASVRSLPSISSVAPMPGLTARPATATRSGWATLPIPSSRCSAKSLIAPSSVAGDQSSAAASTSRSSASTARPAPWFFVRFFLTAFSSKA